MAKAAASPPTDQLTLYKALVATQSEIELKGASMPYTSLNGHMFSFLTKDGALALRLPPAERDAFLKRHKTRLCEQHGRVLDEYVEVPGALLTQTKQLKKYFDMSVTYVGSLKPKPTTRKKNQ